MQLLFLSACFISFAGSPRAHAASADQPASRAVRSLEGFRVRVDERLLPGGTDDEAGRVALDFLSAKLADVRIVVQVSRLVNLTGSAVVPSGGSASYTTTGLSPTSVGTSNLVVSATAGDQSLSGADPLTTLSATTTYTVLAHATSSLLSGTVASTSTTLDLGTWDYSATLWTSGSNAAGFSIFNLAGGGGNALTALLALTSSTSSVDSGFTTNLNTYSQIADGTSQAFSVSFDTTGMTTSGTYSRMFTVNMADQQNLSNAAATNGVGVLPVRRRRRPHPARGQPLPEGEAESPMRTLVTWQRSDAADRRTPLPSGSLGDCRMRHL